MIEEKPTLKVIGAGLGRTGTLSLKTALEELGFSRCYHMTDVFAHRDHAKVWDDAAHGRPVDWDILLFQGKFEDKSYAIDVFNRYNEQVKRVVPADRLLVYEVQEGWEPLCKFLGVPMPADKAFPHLNDTVEFRERIQKVARFMRLIGHLIVVIITLGVVWVIIKLLF